MHGALQNITGIVAFNLLVIIGCVNAVNVLALVLVLLAGRGREQLTEFGHHRFRRMCALGVLYSAFHFAAPLFSIVPRLFADVAFVTVVLGIGLAYAAQLIQFLDAKRSTQSGPHGAPSFRQQFVTWMATTVLSLFLSWIFSMTSMNT